MTAAKLTPQERERQDAIDSYQRQLHAARRLVQLREARSDLLRYTQLSMPDPTDPDNPEASRYQTHNVHRYLADKLMAVERGECLRLIISVQPRVGKSELTSRRLPTWFVGRDPYRQVIVAACTDDLALDFGRECREVMRSKFYQQVFPGVMLRKGNASSERLQTTAGGLLVFAGVGSTVTGRGGQLCVIDDPIKSAEEARSKAKRDSTWTWFTQTLMSRVMGELGAVVICATRWHEDDIIGRLTNPKNPYYNREEASKWTVINLPAFAEEDDPLGRVPGEILWPERTPLAHLESMRRLDPSGFAALYMGKPAPPEGNHFKREYIVPYQAHELPRNLRYYAASDHAVSLEQKRDKTCMGCVGIDDKEDIWILPDLVWRQIDGEVQTEAMLDLMRRYRPMFWWAERGHISMAIGPFLRKRMLEEKTFVSIDERVPSKDKMTRSQAIHGRMSMKKVHFPAFVPWYTDAVDELLNFPNGMHDDFVDWLSWIGIGLDSVTRVGNVVPLAAQPQTGSIQWILQSAERLRKQASANDANRYLN
jgi:predicted phage terminase large subunit-like protein